MRLDVSWPYVTIVLLADGVSVDVNNLITLILGGGAIGTFVAIFKGVKSLRSGAYARQNRLIDRLERRAESAEEDCRYLQVVVGRYAYQLTLSGRTPDPERIELPSLAATRAARAALETGRREPRREKDADHLQA